MELDIEAIWNEGKVSPLNENNSRLPPIRAHAFLPLVPETGIRGLVREHQENMFYCKFGNYFQRVAYAAREVVTSFRLEFGLY